MNNKSSGVLLFLTAVISIAALVVGVLALNSAGKATHDAGSIALQTSTAGYYNAGLGFKLNGATFVGLGAATSTLQIGCITRYATSSATLVKDVFIATTTLGTNGVGVWAVQYGTCP